MAEFPVSITPALPMAIDDKNADLWRLIAGQIAPASRAIYQRDLQQYLQWIMQRGKTFWTATVLDLTEYRQWLLEATRDKQGREDVNGSRYSVTTAQHKFSVISQAYKRASYLRDAQGALQLPVNPILGVRGIKVEDERHIRRYALTREEARQMLDAIMTSRRHRKLRDYALLFLLMTTGLRRQEVAKLLVRDLTRERGHSVLIIRQGKGAKDGKIKVRPEVRRAVDDYLRSRGALTPDMPLFVNRHNDAFPPDGDDIEKIVRECGRFIGYETIKTTKSGKQYHVGTLTPHDLRATFATIALEKAPLHKVQYAMRHKDPRTTERYDRRKFNLDDNAVDAVEI